MAAAELEKKARKAVAQRLSPSLTDVETPFKEGYS